ncbi:MAG: hypothetical protein WBA89_05425 [Microcoleus sp.]
MADISYRVWSIDRDKFDRACGMRVCSFGDSHSARANRFWVLFCMKLLT